MNLNGNNRLITIGPMYDLFYIFISVLIGHMIINLGFGTNDFFYLRNDTI